MATTKVRLTPKQREVLTLIADGSHVILVRGGGYTIYVVTRATAPVVRIPFRRVTLDSLLALRPMVLRRITEAGQYTRYFEATPAAQALLDSLTTTTTTKTTGRA